MSKCIECEFKTREIKNLRKEIEKYKRIIQDLKSHLWMDQEGNLHGE